jgi:hypothetical protein
MKAGLVRAVSIAAALVGLPGAALAWSNHGTVSFQTFRDMPDVASAPPVKVEPIEVFLKDQEPAIAALLDAQEQWARANVTAYPPRPDELAFKPDVSREDSARRRAFLEALRVAPNVRLSLYVQPDGVTAYDPARALPWSAVSTLREPAFNFHRFHRLEPGETVAPLTVLSTASDEPDNGLDINCWDDSPSDWGRLYKFGKLPFGNPALDFSTQAPFHMGFFHQSAIIYKAAPFVARTYPLLRVHQFFGLSQLAFRTGHAYWGWRFAGMAMHYVQDLTQPYHASLFPGVGTFRMIAVNFVAMIGLPRMKNDMIVLVSNRHLALERYQAQVMHRDAATGQGAAIEALRSPARDRDYAAWSNAYVRDVLTAESFAAGEALNEALLTAMPAAYVSDPSFDFGAQGGRIDLMRELTERDPKSTAVLEKEVVALLSHFGAHSRNLVRAVLAGQEKTSAR